MGDKTAEKMLDLKICLLAYMTAFEQDQKQPTRFARWHELSTMKSNEWGT